MLGVIFLQQCLQGQLRQGLRLSQRGEERIMSIRHAGLCLCSRSTCWSAAT